MFNENTDQFLFRKNFRSVFNKNTNQFFIQKNFQICIYWKYKSLKKEGVFSNLLQISKFKEELNLKCVNQLLNNILNMWTWQKKKYRQGFKDNE